MTRKLKEWLFGVVWAHTLIVILHSISHFGNDNLPGSVGDYTFIISTNLVGPLAALWLLNRGSDRTGALLVAVSLVGAFGYGLINHFLVSSADNAFELTPGGWQTAFLSTSGLLLIVEVVGFGIALWSLATSWSARRVIASSVRR